MDSVIFQLVTFNPVEVNGIKTFDNMFIVLDNEDKIGCGMIFPQEIQQEDKAC
jgi:hypothetical protein